MVCVDRIVALCRDLDLGKGVSQYQWNAGSFVGYFGSCNVYHVRLLVHICVNLDTTHADGILVRDSFISCPVIGESGEAQLLIFLVFSWPVYRNGGIKIAIAVLFIKNLTISKTVVLVVVRIPKGCYLNFTQVCRCHFRGTCV